MSNLKFEHPIYVTKPLIPPTSTLLENMRIPLETGVLTNGGALHKRLEEKVRLYLDAENFSLFNNGTIALIVACQALRLSGEVITTPFTFPATPHVLSWNGLTPVFADIDPVTLNLDPSNIVKLITNRSRAILADHVYGSPCDVAAVENIANRHGLKVIYDAAHAFGSTVNGVPISRFGDASMFSFHATKLFHTGEGGGLAVRTAEVKNRVDLLKNFGIKSEFEVLMPGINGKLSELHCAMGISTFEMIKEEIGLRANIATIYDEGISDIRGLVRANPLKEEESSFQYYAIRVKRNDTGLTRDSLYEKLKSYNVFARKYFYPLCSEYSCYRLLPSSDPAGLPNAHQVADEVLCLPFYGELGSHGAKKIVQILRNIVEKDNVI